MERFRVVLVEPEHQGNIGSVARAMRNFDLHDLWIVNPKTKIDLGAESLAAHGRNILAASRTVQTLHDAIDGCDIVVGTSSITSSLTSNLRRNSTTARELARRLASSHGRIAILFGRESSGLRNEELDLCDFVVSIPTSREYRALNVAQAATIVFYEIFASRQGSPARALASGDAKRHLLNYLDQLARSSDIPPHRRTLSVRAFRSIISRAMLTPREATLLIGVFRRALRQVEAARSARAKRGKAVTI